MATKNPKERVGGHSTSFERGSPGPGGDKGGGRGKDKDDDGGGKGGGGGKDKDDDDIAKVHNELVIELDSVSYMWKEIGLKLGVPNHVLKVINDDLGHKTQGTKLCFIEMLETWVNSNKKNPNDVWITVCKVLKESESIRLAEIVAKKHGLYPRITEDPQGQHVALGCTVTFRCKASSIESKNPIYQWFHMRDGREVIKQSTSAKLDIKEVTDNDRGKYRCAVENVFGEVKSEPAALIIGVQLNEYNLKRILNEAGIENTDWPEIGRCLGQDVRSAFVEGIHMRIQECPMDNTKLWHKLAETLKGMEGCVSAAQKAENYAGKELDENTVIEMFKEFEIENPDWCRIDEVLGHLATPHPAWERFEENQKSTEDALQGSQNRTQQHNQDANHTVTTIFRHKVTWEKLAKALEQIQEYHLVAKKVKDKYAEITRERVRDVFMDASTVDWNQVAKRFPSFNESCLIKMLMTWYMKEECKDPRTIWRKLAASVEILKEDNDDSKVKDQLGIAYKLRQRSGVGLELNKVNLCKVLKEAGIKDWSTIVSGLKLDPNWITKKVQKLAKLFWEPNPVAICTDILKKWPEPQSWEELARVIEDLIDGPEIAQKTRELSGSGGYPKIRDLYTPELDRTNVTSEMRVTFTCDARGAPPLKYTWMHNGKDIRGPTDKRTIELKVGEGGEYNCRVKNNFGSDTSKEPIQLNCGIAPSCKFDRQKMNIPVGEKLSLHCKVVQGTDPFQYTWLHNGVKLPPKSEKYHVDGPDLTIMEMTQDDAGRYECGVFNDFGDEKSSIKVKVGKPPVIESTDLEGTKRVHYVRGEKLRFYCKASGTPVLRYTWQCTGVKDVTTLGSDEKQTVITAEDKEGEYICNVKNDFGETSSPIPIKIEVGDSPEIKDRPKILGKVVPGECVQLTCEVAAGKGHIKYVWMRDNQTLVKEAGSCRENKAELTIERMAEAHQGEYTCRFTNAFGFSVSESVLVELQITVEEVMNQLCPHRSTPISRRWYMLGILLEVHKTILDRISRGFAASGDFKYSLQEVIISWLERKRNPKKSRTCTWATIQDAVCRMGYVKLVEDLGAKPEIEAPIKVEGTIALGEKIILTCKATGKPPLRYTWWHNGVETHEINNSKFAIQSMDESHKGDYKCKVSNEAGSAESEAVTLNPGSQIEDEVKRYDARDMSTKFENLAGKVENILTNSNSSDTDIAVSGIQAYLLLIKFKKEDVERVKDLQSVIKFLRQYWNYQRYHLLKKVVYQFSSEPAKTKMQVFIDQFDTYQATTILGDFVPSLHPEGAPYSENPVRSTLEEDPATTKNPPFMKSFKLKLESKWATCTLRDTDNLLGNLLPDTISREFVWFSTVYQAKEENSVCLEYLVSHTVAELLSDVMEMKRKDMRSMGILCIQVDSIDFNRESSITRFHIEEQETNPDIRTFQLQMKQLEEELKDDVKDERRILTNHASKIEALQRELQETRSNQASKIKALKSELESEIKALEEKGRKQCLDIETLQHDLQQEIKALQQRFEETKRKQGSDIVALQQDLEDTKSKQIEVLQQDLKETKNTHGSRIRALQQDLDNIKKDLVKGLSQVSTEVDSQAEKYKKQQKKDKEFFQSTVNGYKSRVAEEVKKEVTSQVSSAKTYTKLRVPNARCTGEKMEESASETGTKMRSQEQRHHPELLGATSIIKKLEEEMAQQRIEFRTREETTAKLLEELKRKIEDKTST